MGIQNTDYNWNLINAILQFSGIVLSAIIAICVFYYGNRNEKKKAKKEQQNILKKNNEWYEFSLLNLIEKGINPAIKEYQEYIKERENNMDEIGVFSNNSSLTLQNIHDIDYKSLMKYYQDLGDKKFIIFKNVHAALNFIAIRYDTHDVGSIADLFKYTRDKFQYYESVYQDSLNEIQVYYDSLFNNLKKEGNNEVRIPEDDTFLIELVKLFVNKFYNNTEIVKNGNITDRQIFIDEFIDKVLNLCSDNILDKRAQRIIKLAGDIKNSKIEMNNYISRFIKEIKWDISELKKVKKFVNELIS